MRDRKLDQRAAQRASSTQHLGGATGAAGRMLTRILWSQSRCSYHRLDHADHAQQPASSPAVYVVLVGRVLRHGVPVYQACCRHACGAGQRRNGNMYGHPLRRSQRSRWRRVLTFRRDEA